MLLSVFLCILVVSELLVIGHPVLIILDHIVNLHNQLLNALLLRHIHAVVIHQRVVVNHADQCLVQLKKAATEKLLSILASIQLQHHFLCAVVVGEFLKHVLVLDLVALRQHVQVRRSHLHHRRDRSQAASHVLGWLVDLSAVSAVDSAHIQAFPLQCLGKSLHHIEVRVELNLPWAVKQDKRVVRELLEFLQ